MVIGKRFEIVNRVVRIAGRIPISRVKEFGLVEVFHAGVEQNRSGSPFITCGRYRRMTKPEKIGGDRSRFHHKRLKALSTTRLIWEITAGC
jgi:hypothetical protein